MRNRLAVACGIVLITWLGFFQYPGHTYLQSDTQIYVPMLERIYDPSALRDDLVAKTPHLAFTLYDDFTLGLRRPGIPFQAGLTVQQLLFRASQNLGVYLLAGSLPLPPIQAMAVAAIAGLGASIAGPSVLLIEYEPIPRGFAVGLVFLAIGLAARNRPLLASISGAVAFLYHAPASLPFWILWRRKWLPLAIACAALFLAFQFQPGVAEKQQFFLRIDGAWEQILRLRASYDWVSLWAGSLMPYYLLLWLISLLAYWRVRSQAGWQFLLGLPVVGLLSIPLSYLLLEKLKWALMPQIQPARTLLFVPAMALILGSAAAFRAKHELERFVWFGFVFLIPLMGFALQPHWILSLGMAILATGLFHVRQELVFVPILALFFLAPPQHHPIETNDLIGLETFARDHTPSNAMFAFPQSGRGLEPGVFRARATRSVYVDWKAGGQSNYYRSVAMEWWDRWNHPLPPGRIDYEVLTKRDPARTPVYENGAYSVYRLMPNIQGPKDAAGN